MNGKIRARALPGPLFSGKAGTLFCFLGRGLPFLGGLRLGLFRHFLDADAAAQRAQLGVVLGETLLHGGRVGRAPAENELQQDGG